MLLIHKLLGILGHSVCYDTPSKKNCGHSLSSVPVTACQQTFVCLCKYKLAPTQYTVYFYRYLFCISVPYLKGLFANFTQGGIPRNSFQLRNTVYFRYRIFSIPVVTTVDFTGSQIGPIAPFLLLLDHSGPIRDTINSTAVVTGIEKI